MEILEGLLKQNNLKRELPDFFASINTLTRTENALYGREKKPRDFIVSFLSAGNVSNAKVRINGHITDLDSRPDKPAKKDCELTEAAVAVFELINSKDIHETNPDILVELGMHVMSEVGDVLYNLMQLYLLEEGLENWEYVRAKIRDLFELHKHAALALFMLNVAEEKFNIRYFQNGKKNVEDEEKKLQNKYGEIFLEILDFYGGLENLLVGVKEIIFSSLAVSMEASYGADHLRDQIVQAESIIVGMARGASEA
ncbi:MAG: hypothetical protein ABI721_01540 [Candidatus Dojkabacteria bacterium]